MNRLFGKGKPKEPGPSITDCITNVKYIIIFLSFIASTFAYFVGGHSSGGC